MKILILNDEELETLRELAEAYIYENDDHMLARIFSGLTSDNVRLIQAQRDVVNGVLARL